MCSTPLSGVLALTLLSSLAPAALAQSRPAPTVAVSSTPIPVTQQPTGSVDPSQQTGTVPGLPGVQDSGVFQTVPTPAANAVQSPRASVTLAPGPNAPPSSAAYKVSGLVVGYEPGKAISIRTSTGMVRTMGLTANLNVPPDLTNGRYVTVTLQRRAKGSPAVLAVTMSQQPIVMIKKKS